MSKRKVNNFQQGVIGTSFHGKPVKLGEENLKNHALAIGGKGMGKTYLFAAFLHNHQVTGFPTAVFDSKGILWNYGLSVAASLNERNICLVDSTDPDHVAGIGLMEGRWILDPSTASRVEQVVTEAVARSNDPAPPAWPNWQDARSVWFFLKGLFPDHSYFQLSMLAPRGPWLKMSEEILEGKSLFFKIPPAVSSTTYRMLVFDRFLQNALTCRPPTPYLVFVDQAYDFVSGKLNKRMLDELTERGIYLVFSSSYTELGWFKKNNPTLYSTLLNDCAVTFGFGANQDEPYDVIEDVAAKLFLKPRRLLM